MTRRGLAAVWIALAVLAAGLAWSASAGAAEQAPTWASLTAAQKAALAPLERDWASLDPQNKQKWLELATHFPSMPAAERQRVQERMAAWARMTPLQRGQARLQFQETRQLSPQERQARWEAYKALPPDQRRELAHRARPGARGASAADNHAANAGAKGGASAPARRTVAKPIAPSLVQAKPGVTTSLISVKPPQPLHPQVGAPKIAATPRYVNPETLLPRRGPQAAASKPADKSASKP